MQTYNLTEVDTSQITNEQWYRDIKLYLEDVMGMNPQQVRTEFIKRFPELIQGDLI